MFPIPSIFPDPLIDPPQPEPPEKAFRMQVVQEGLRKRTSPSIFSKVVGLLHDGDVLTVDEIHGTDAWIAFYDQELGIEVFANVKSGPDRNMKSVKDSDKI